MRRSRVTRMVPVAFQSWRCAGRELASQRQRARALAIARARCAVVLHLAQWRSVVARGRSRGERMRHAVAAAEARLLRRAWAAYTMWHQRRWRKRRVLRRAKIEALRSKRDRVWNVWKAVTAYCRWRRAAERCVRTRGTMRALAAWRHSATRRRKWRVAAEKGTRWMLQVAWRAWKSTLAARRASLERTDAMRAHCLHARDRAMLAAAFAAMAAWTTRQQRLRYLCARVRSFRP